MRTKFKETEIGLIPADWNLDKLDNLTTKIATGSTPPSDVREYGNNGVNFVRSSNIFDFHINKENIIKLNKESIKYVKNSEVESGDVLLNITGDGITFLRDCIATDDILPAYTNQSIAIIRPKKLINGKYLSYYLSLSRVKKYMEAFNAGSARRTLAAKHVREFLIPFPNIEEQIKISNIIFSLNEKIELNQQMNRTLEAIGQAIFKHWFVHFEFPDENGQPYKSSSGDMVDSELGEIPSNWKVGTLGKLISITSGKRPNKKSEEKTNEFKIPLIGASSLMGFVKETLYNEPILVIGRVGTHGVVQKIMPPSHPSDNTLVIKSKFYEFVYQILKRIDYDSLNVGTTQPLITQKSIKNHEILIPTSDILEKFEIISKLFFLKFYHNTLENENLSKVRDSLLPKLMSGKIRIPMEATTK